MKPGTSDGKEDHGGHGGRRGGHGRHDHGGRGRRDGGCEEEQARNFQSAQTFRRGRVLMFLERLQVQRNTLMQQLTQPEFQSIAPIITGELKAVDQVMQDYIHTFELREIETTAAKDTSTSPHSASDQQDTE
ncbi:hypothetical protein [Paenibacillus dendrobii]|uniref:hypothetical protein n=1 Tax=Paenibacillus dendrobii TaxID=2691084 RepID=UPI0019213859|nr:hypothetical protein [Paenibacillus dendrobii]